MSDSLSTQVFILLKIVCGFLISVISKAGMTWYLPSLLTSKLIAKAEKCGKKRYDFLMEILFLKVLFPTFY